MGANGVWRNVVSCGILAEVINDERIFFLEMTTDCVYCLLNLMDKTFKL